MEGSFKMSSLMRFMSSPFCLFIYLFCSLFCFCLRATALCIILFSYIAVLTFIFLINKKNEVDLESTLYCLDSSLLNIF